MLGVALAGDDKKAKMPLMYGERVLRRSADDHVLDHTELSTALRYTTHTTKYTQIRENVTAAFETDNSIAL